MSKPSIAALLALATATLAAAPLVRPAAAAEIRVSTPKTAWVYVNGDMIEYPPGGGDLLKVEDLAQGTHEVVVRNWFGKKVASTSVELPYEGVAELKYANKQLTLISATPMKPPEEAAPGKVIIAGATDDADGTHDADSAHVLATEPGEDDEADGASADGADGAPGTMKLADPAVPDDGPKALTEGEPDAATPPVAAAAVVITNATEDDPTSEIPVITVGSLEFSGLEKSTTQIDIDGQAIMYYPDLKTFVAIKLEPGMHKVLVRTTAGDAFGGELEVRADANQHCEVVEKDGAKDFDCEWRTPALGPR